VQNRFLIVCGGCGYKLLGQHMALNLSGELHIDVSNEIPPPLEPLKDKRSLAIKLDELIPASGLLLDDLEQRINQPIRSGHSDYAQTAITHPQDIAHAQFLIDHYPTGSPLKYELVSPAVGGAMIRTKQNVRALNAALKMMVTKWADNIGFQNPLEVWIISSTAGGTGEGVHRFVAASLADILKKRKVQYLVLNFLRIGPLTYRSVSQERTTLNSFFGIAADAAFELKFKEDFPGASINWFYIDFPDVGTGDRAKEVRGEIIEMAAKAIMLDELAEDLNRLLINNNGIRMVVARAGYWRKDLGDRLKGYGLQSETMQETSSLTRAELVNILGGDLPEKADVRMILDTLRGRCGRIIAKSGNECEAQWWQSTQPPGISAQYMYRILPQLEPGLQEALRSAAEEDRDIRYIFAKLGVVGLYVLALHGVSLNKSPGPDTTSTPAYLLQPMIPVVRNILAQWKEAPRKNEPSGQFAIVCAGVIGEPLYIKALREAGLTEEELEKIGQYYQFYGE
jgi:hypothetical protein